MAKARQTTPGVFKVNLGGPVPGQDEPPPVPMPGGKRADIMPGSNANPKGRGRPKTGESFAELITAEMERIADDYLSGEESPNDDPSALSVKQAIVRKFIRQALSGNLLSWVELMNRTEGKVADKVLQQVEHAVKVVPWDDDGNPAVVYVDDQNVSDRGETDRMGAHRPNDVPALPDMYPPETTDAEFTVSATEAEADR